MTNYSRRRILCDLGTLSASAAVGFPLLGDALAAPTGAASWPPPGSPNDLYIIFSGPWLFWMSADNKTLQAITVDYNNHSYTHFDPLQQPITPTTLGMNAKYTLSVTGYTAAPDRLSLVKSMLLGNQGLIYNGNVTLSGTMKPDGPTISIPTPTRIHPAALMKGVQFTFDPTCTQNTQVLEWPSALLLVYSGWSSASLSNDSGTDSLSLTNQKRPTHLEFRIQPSTPPTSECDSSGQSTSDAPGFFSKLMTLMSFPNGQPPSISIPPCVDGQNPIQVRHGDDGNVGCGELGLDPSCTNNAWQPLIMSHPSPSASAKHGPFLQLVNCASGHGGVGGCC